MISTHVFQPRSEVTLCAKEQDVDETRYDGRNREWQIDQSDESVLAAKLEFGDRPRRGKPDHDVERDGDGCDKERKPDCCDRIRFQHGVGIGAPAARQRFGEDGNQRQEQKQREICGRNSDQRQPWRQPFGAHARGLRLLWRLQCGVRHLRASGG